MLVDTKPIELFRSLGLLSEKLQKAKSYNDIIKVARDEVEAMLGFKNIWFYLDEKGGSSEYQLLSLSGRQHKIARQTCSKLDVANDPFLKEIVSGTDLVYVEDARTDPRTNKEIVNTLGNITLINYPITLYGQTLGFVGSGSFNDEGVVILSSTDKEYFIALVNIIAVAIDRVYLINISNVDHLTGLHNRRSMLECGTIAVARAKRHQRQVGLIYIDMDGFKAINDNHGHAVGDELLRSFASTLKTNLRKSDIVSRIGGDEFIIILTELSSPAEMDRITQHLRNTCRESELMKDRGINYNYSIGTASFPRDGETIEALLDAADKRMYLDKQCEKQTHRKPKLATITPPRML